MFVQTELEKQRSAHKNESSLYTADKTAEIKRNSSPDIDITQPSELMLSPKI